MSDDKALRDEKTGALVSPCCRVALLGDGTKCPDCGKRVNLERTEFLCATTARATP